LSISARGFFKKFKKLTSEQLLKKSAIVLFLRIVGMALAYVAIILISRTFGAETYGRFSLLLTTIQFLVLLFSLGLPQLMIKLTADKRFYDITPKNNYLYHALIAILVSGIIGSILLYFSVDIIAVNIFRDPLLIPYFKTLSYFFVFFVLHSFLVEFLKGRKLFINYGLYLYVMPYLLFFIIYFVFYDKEINITERAIYFSYLIPFLIITVITFFFLPLKQLKTTKAYTYKDLFQLSFPMLFSATFIFISNWTDVFMLGAMATKAEVGIYNAAYKLAIIALLVITAVNTVLAPRISELYSKNNLEEIKKEVQKATKIITYITIPIVVVLIVFRKQLLGMFGLEFVQGEQVLIIVSLGLLFNALSGSVAIIMNMTKHQKELRNFTLISAFINILLNYFLIKEMGIDGAAIASLISAILFNITCIWYIKKKLGFFTFLKY